MKPDPQGWLPRSEANNTYVTRDGFVFTPISLDRRIKLARVLDAYLRDEGATAVNEVPNRHANHMITRSELLWLLHQCTDDEHWSQVRPRTTADQLTAIADLIDKGVDGTGNQPLTIMDEPVLELIQDVDWRGIAEKLRRLT